MDSLLTSTLFLWVRYEFPASWVLVGMDNGGSYALGSSDRRSDLDARRFRAVLQSVAR